MSEQQHLPIIADERVAVHFEASGKTESFHGIEPSASQKKEFVRANIFGYILVAFDAFEISASILTGFLWHDYLMIGAATFGSIAWFMPKERRTNFFQMEQDKIVFSRTQDETALMATLIQFRLAKPTVLSLTAGEIELMELTLDEACVFLKNGKKATMNLVYLDSKYTIQDLLMVFCDKHGIRCQLSSLALDDRKKR